MTRQEFIDQFAEHTTRELTRPGRGPAFEQVPDPMFVAALDALLQAERRGVRAELAAPRETEPGPDEAGEWARIRDLYQVHGDPFEGTISGAVTRNRIRRILAWEEGHAETCEVFRWRTKASLARSAGWVPFCSCGRGEAP